MRRDISTTARGESIHEQRTDLDKRSIIAFDIGGANIKAAHSSGPILTIPFEVWKRPDELARAIAGAAARCPIPIGLSSP